MIFTKPVILIVKEIHVPIFTKSRIFQRLGETIVLEILTIKDTECVTFNNVYLLTSIYSLNNNINISPFFTSSSSLHSKSSIPQSGGYECFKMNRMTLMLSISTGP